MADFLYIKGLQVSLINLFLLQALPPDLGLLHRGPPSVLHLVDFPHFIVRLAMAAEGMALIPMRHFDLR